jgi:UDP-glucose 4-epimerase
MSTLVVGGAGYIGSTVVHQLVNQGEEVVVIDDLSTGHPASLPKHVRCVVARVQEVDRVRSVINEYKVDTVMMFAASLSAPESVEDPLKYYENNIGGVIALLSAINCTSVKRLIFSSTAAVYGATKSSMTLTEITPLNPSNPYGMTKMVGEQMITSAADRIGIKYAILRYFNVLGADLVNGIGPRNPKATHLLKNCFNAIKNKSELSIYGTDYDTPDGTCLRDYVHVKDVSEAHIQAVRYLEEDTPSITLNVGTGEGYSVEDMVVEVERVTGMMLPVIHAPRREGDVARAVADNKRIRSRFGWEPEHSDLTSMVQDAWEWEQQLT